MHIDDFAPNLSFFFSNGMDPEYTVLGRVARPNAKPSSQRRSETPEPVIQGVARSYLSRCKGSEVHTPSRFL